MDLIDSNFATKKSFYSKTFALPHSHISLQETTSIFLYKNIDKNHQYFLPEDSFGIIFMKKKKGSDFSASFFSNFSRYFIGNCYKCVYNHYRLSSGIVKLS